MNNASAYLEQLSDDDQRLVRSYLAHRGAPDIGALVGRELGLAPGEVLRRLQVPRVHDALHRCLDEIMDPQPDTDPQLIDSHYVMEHLVRIVESSLLDFAIVHEDGTVSLDLSKDNVHALREVATLDLTTENVPTGGTKRRVRVKLHDKLRALQLLGQHVNVRAFVEQHRVESVVADIEQIQAGRDRLAKHKAQEDDSDG